jgi:hypothetical protein
MTLAPGDGRTSSWWPPKVTEMRYKVFFLSFPGLGSEPSMYNAQGIFQDHFQCKKVCTILDKIRYSLISENDYIECLFIAINEK